LKATVSWKSEAAGHPINQPFELAGIQAKSEENPNKI
jgi:hypothetical protein